MEYMFNIRPTHSKDYSSYRPVALTSLLTKTLKRLVRQTSPLPGEVFIKSAAVYLPAWIQAGWHQVDDDAIIYVLHQALIHLEKPESTVRIVIFDFFSAFNIIQPRLRRDKLEPSGVDHHLSQCSVKLQISPSTTQDAIYKSSLMSLP